MRCQLVSDQVRVRHGNTRVAIALVLHPELEEIKRSGPASGASEIPAMSSAAHSNVPHRHAAEGDLQSFRHGRKRLLDLAKETEGLQFAGKQRNREKVQLEAERMGESAIGGHRMDDDAPAHGAQRGGKRNGAALEAAAFSKCVMDDVDRVAAQWKKRLKAKG